MEGGGKDPTRSQLTTVQGADGKPHVVLIDLDTGATIKDISIKPDESPNGPKRDVPGDVKVQGTGAGTVVFRANADGTWDFDPKLTADMRKQAIDEDARKEKGATDRASDLGQRRHGHGGHLHRHHRRQRADLPGQREQGHHAAHR